MAYIKDDVDTRGELPVAGAAPLSQGTGAAPQTTSQNQQQSGQVDQPQSTTPSQPNQQDLQNQLSTQNAGANKRASSGSFTNVQNYVERNKPQTQQLARTATQDMTKRAQDIRSAVQQKNQQQQQQLTAEQAKLNQQFNQAGGLVNKMMGIDYYKPQGATTAQVAPQNQQQNQTISPTAFQGNSTAGGNRYVAMSNNVESTPSFDDKSAELRQLEYEAQAGDDFSLNEGDIEAAAQQYASLMQGPTGVNQVRDLAISGELARAKALSNLAGNVNREGQRRAMLAQTLGGTGYTTGQSRLDDMILSRDKQAMQQLAQDTKSSTEGLQDYLKETGRTSAEALGAFRDDLSGFGEKVTGFATGAEEMLQRDIEKRYQEELRRREALLGQFDEEGNFIGGSDYFDKAQAGGQARVDDITNRFGNTQGFHRELSSLLPSYIRSYDALNYTGNEDAIGRFNVNRHAGSSRRDRVRDAVSGIYDEFSPEDNELLGFQDSFSGFMSDAGYNSGMSKWQKNRFTRDIAQSMYDQIGKDIKEVGPMDKRIQDYIAAKSGQQGISYADLASGADINRYQTADQNYIDRVNALNRLLGRNTLTSGQTGRDRQYASIDDMMANLKKYEDLGKK